MKSLAWPSWRPVLHYLGRIKALRGVVAAFPDWPTDLPSPPYRPKAVFSPPLAREP